ncbi:MAG: peptide-methionine (R)-S-oxide reductase MsrB [Owenweeksia sp.]|nr:peptide-methionine (R)-S-oxide reductase MsrB [Owenweeksia sp.]
MKPFFTIMVLLGSMALLKAQSKNDLQTQKETEEMEYKVKKTNEEWQAELSTEEFRVLREAGTERPFTGAYNMHFDDGVYKCAACEAALFSSDAKFESHCGWPSFDQAIGDSTVVEKVDKSHGMVRTEILCANCGSHLGHVFNDGPTETGMRYCINSVSLGFDGEKEKASEEKASEKKPGLKSSQ